VDLPTAWPASHHHKGVFVQPSHRLDAVAIPFKRLGSTTACNTTPLRHRGYCHAQPAGAAAAGGARYAAAAAPFSAKYGFCRVASFVRFNCLLPLRFLRFAVAVALLLHYLRLQYPTFWRCLVDCYDHGTGSVGSASFLPVGCFFCTVLLRFATCSYLPIPTSLPYWLFYHAYLTGSHTTSCLPLLGRSYSYLGFATTPACRRGITFTTTADFGFCSLRSACIPVQRLAAAPLHALLGRFPPPAAACTAACCRHRRYAFSGFLPTCRRAYAATESRNALQPTGSSTCATFYTTAGCVCVLLLPRIDPLRGTGLYRYQLRPPPPRTFLGC